MICVFNYFFGNFGTLMVYQFPNYPPNISFNKSINKNSLIIVFHQNDEVFNIFLKN